MTKRLVWVFASLAVGLVLILSSIAFIYFSNGDNIFFSASQITSGQNYSQDPVAVRFQSQVYVAYELEEGSNNSIILGIFKDNSLTNLVKASFEGDNTNPCIVTWNGKIYLFWDTTDSLSTDGKDRDIAMRSYDGTNWGNIVDVSSWAKSENSEDSQPKAIVYAEKIHIIWENETSILHRCLDSTGEMSQVVEVGKGWGADIEVFNGSLYVTWTTYYDSGTEDTSVYLRSYAGDAWNDEIVSINPHIGYLDYFPSMEEFENKLYIAWVTKDKTISSGVRDDDIVVRCYDPAMGNLTSSGAWSAVTELSGAQENWDDWPLLFSDSENLYAVWQTWNLATNNGDMGDDLVMRRMSQGEWGEIVAITDSQRQDGDIYERGYSVISFGDGINVFFQNRTAKTTGTDWQIWLASID